jgi:multidrug efflux pump subunit AcrA (membrane-fusion protein)
VKTTELAGPSGATWTAQPDVRSLLLGLHELRQSQVDAAFWASFCHLLAALCRSRAALVASRAEAGEWEEQGRGGADFGWLASVWKQLVGDVADRAAANGFAYVPASDLQGQPRLFAAVRVLGAGDTLVLLDIGGQERGMLNELLMRAMLVADVSAQSRSPAPGTALVDAGARRGDGDLLSMLDLVAQVMAATSFELASLKLVNGVAAHYHLPQVALGWVQSSGQRVAAVSHLEKFERNSENIRLIAAALDETAAEESPLCHPPVEGWRAGGPALAALCDTVGVGQACTLPQRDREGNVQSVLLLTFRDAQQRLPEIGSLLLAQEMLQPWLADLRARDRWWGARLAAWAQGHLEHLFGPGHPWVKAAAVAASLLALYGVFGTWNYKVEASAAMTTDATRLVSAQFDSRVEEVHATAGDLVRAGALLAQLDTRDLRQQELEALAELKRYEAEASKHRADENLAEMEVALARTAQAEARLARLRDYIAHGRNVAPFDGVVVEGERKDLQGMPVKKGDALFRVAQVKDLYAQLHVAERDVRDIRAGAKGELTLLARPDQRIPFELAAVIPVAQVKGQEGNQFMLTARLLAPPESWWRPGMTGLAKVEVGERNVTWVFTHRLIDALRMKLWW